jgi:hypothetical protein
MEIVSTTAVPSPVRVLRDGEKGFDEDLIFLDHGGLVLRVRIVPNFDCGRDLTWAPKTP